jgi:transposase-like protein
MGTKYALKSGTASVIRGAGLAHRRYFDADQRADMAADVVTEERAFVPSHQQACQIFGVSPRKLWQRVKARRGNGNGQPSDPIAVAETNGSAPDVTVDPVSVYSIVMALLNATPAQRAEVARELGCDWTWDHLIMPCMRSNAND